MARHRPSRRASSKIRDAVSPPPKFSCESLEQRLLFVVLHGGDVFEFYSENSHFERVIVTGNTTVELIGSHIDTMSAGFSLNAMQGVIFQGPDSVGTINQGTTTIMNGQVNTGFPPNAVMSGGGGGGGGTGGMMPTFSDNIFAIYVSQSDFTSNIAIAQVPSLTTTPRPMQPYTGNITLRVNPTVISGVVPPFTVTSVANSGGALLGARTINPPGAQNQDNIPILQAPLANVPAGTFVTLPPQVNNILPAGLTVAAGNDMNAFLFGGTITGQVNIQGSINQFYAGWIVTGNAIGEDDIGIVTHAVNFNVDGNLGDLITPASIGTENDALIQRPDYSSGFDMHVGGVLGEMSSQDAILGNVNVSHSPSVPPPGNASEIEFRGRPPNFDSWDQAILGNQSSVTFMNNDTFETAQFLGTTDGAGDVVVDGELQTDVPIADYVDYYAVALMAGQTVNVQLQNTTGTLISLNVGVFDPTGRLIATDYSQVDPTQTHGEPFQITTDRPGTYRFAVAESVNPEFAAVPASTVSSPIATGYELTIRHVGDVAVGGLFANGNILDNPDVADFAPTPTNERLFSMIAGNGDWGSVYSHGSIFGVDGDALFTGAFNATTPGTGGIHQISYAVPNGNLRAVEGAQIGFIGGTAGVNLPPSCYVPNGSVGYLHATSTTGLLAWNFMGVLTTAQSLAPQAALSVAIGGDYQFIDAANQFWGNLIAAGNIGSIRAGSMTASDAANNPGYFQVNAGNSTSRHGIIDLIDSAGDIGTNGTGGPAIITGPGGDVRYIVVGGTAHRDLAFGGGAPEDTTYQPGEVVNLTDDSGAVVQLTPVGTTTAQASLTVLTYPIRGSGGSAIVRAVTTGGIDVSASGAGGVAEIGSIVVNGAGSAVVNNNTVQPGNRGGTTTGGGGTVTPGARRGRARRAVSFPGPGQPGGAPVPGGSGGVTTGTGTPGGPPAGTNNVNAGFTLPTLATPPSLPANATPLTVTIDGPDRLDVWGISGGNITALTDNTPGEIVNLNLASLGVLITRGSLGVPTPVATASAVLGNVVPADGDRGEPWTYPFLQPTNLIRVTGNIISISAAKGVGNIYAGFITSGGPGAVPNSLTPPIPDGGAISLGVDGNIGSVTGKLLAPVVAAGSIGSVTIQGSGGSRSGAVGAAGLYAVGVIGPVVSTTDFKGVIDSSGSGGNGGIISVTVNGVLSQATIASFDRFDYVEPRTPGTAVNGNNIIVSAPVVDIGSVQARDGIIGSLVEGDHLGTVTSSDAGFGIFDSRVITTGAGTLQSISTGGYGLRADFIQIGAKIGSIVARGNGNDIATTNFPASVRLSETGGSFDPDTGIPISLLNDIDVYLGTLSAPHIIAGVTDTGVIEDSQFVGSRDIGSVSAWSIRGRNINGSLSGNVDFTEVFAVAATTINIADRIGSITTTGPVRGFNLTTGRATKMRFGSDVAGLNMTVAGPIGNLVFNGSLLSDSFITAQGPAGRIGSLTIHGSLDGGVRASGKIGKIRIDGNLLGNVTAASLGTLSMGGGIGNGALTIDTNVNTIQTDGDLGVAGSVLTINGSLQNLKVGRNLIGTVTVGSNLRNLNVNGSIVTGTAVTVGNTLTLIKVGGDFQAGAVIKAHIIKKKIVKGQDLGTIMTT